MIEKYKTSKNIMLYVQFILVLVDLANKCFKFLGG